MGAGHLQDAAGINKFLKSVSGGRRIVVLL